MERNPCKTSEGDVESSSMRAEIAATQQAEGSFYIQAGDLGLVSLSGHPSGCEGT